MKRLIALLVALVAASSLLSVCAQPAAADPIQKGTEIACEVGAAGAFGTIGAIAGASLCDKVGDAVSKKVKEEWNGVWHSVLGDAIKSGEDVARWVVRKTLTVALMGPSLDLTKIGLWGKGSTSLAGMLVWLGWVIATFGLMWQIGKMAVTGQMKYLGQALVGWVQNALLSGIGLTIVASLLTLGDKLSSGLVNNTFGSGQIGLKRIVAVLLPAISNPITVLGVVSVLLTIGFIQLVLIFLRQSAIPIQCMLLPIAGAGRIGGEKTRQWAPRLITSILVVIAYKPIVTIIICIGFSEFGHAQTLSEWLRGIATLILAVLAPGPLTKLFAPIGAEVGGGMSVGGALGAVANLGSFIGRGKDGSDSSGGGAEPTTAVEQAAYLQQTMGKGAPDPDPSGGGEPGNDAVMQAGRNQPQASVPGQGGTPDGETAGPEAAGLGATPGAPGSPGVSGVSGKAAATKAAAGVGLAIEVIDGVNDLVQQSAGEIGNGGSKK